MYEKPYPKIESPSGYFKPYLKWGSIINYDDRANTATITVHSCPIVRRSPKDESTF